MSDAIHMRQGRCSALNISVATQVSTVPKDQTLASARLVKVSVITAGSTVGGAYDNVGAATAATQVAAIPNTVGVYQIDWPISAGIYIVPGTGQVVSVCYD